MKSFYSRFGKRIFDVVAASVALIAALPMLGVLGLLVKVTSPGPVFFRQERVGRRGKVFRIAKLRSMFVNADRAGLPITGAGDPRITWIGRILRACKIDELPQLWNVLKGDMSFVGPRPEVPRYVESYSAAQREVLSVRPGITDPASIAYRDEERLLGTQADPERYYREIILPHKLDLNREYLSRMSLAYDAYLLTRTISVVVVPKRHRVGTFAVRPAENRK